MEKEVWIIYEKWFENCGLEFHVDCDYAQEKSYEWQEREPETEFYIKKWLD